MDLTPDQITKLESLGVKPLSATPPKNHQTTFIPLISISGITLISFGGLVLLKTKNSSPPIVTPIINQSPSGTATPTQIPKSIQHYLLTSQQYFTQALALQSSNASEKQSSIIDLLNQSILAASESIKEFPSDYRGYYQRSRIYQSLTDSKPDLVDQAISDLIAAEKLNPDSADITRELAALYAKKGDVAQTLAYLTQTVVLEPTKAQNFYDLARLQQQTGLVPQALQTYNRLLPLITDLSQKTQVENEKLALEKLVSQNSATNTLPQAPRIPQGIGATPSPKPTIICNDNPPTIQANIGSGLIIAAPETSKDINVNNLTDSNSLAGQSTLPANTKEVTIFNNNLSSSSQVYLSTIKGGDHHTLQILSKSNQSFTVGFDAPISEPVEFKWWIIN